MFEDYLQDSHSYYQLADNAKKNERIARRHYRASIFFGFSALEAFVNYIGETYTQGDTLEDIELAFLNDETIEIQVSTGRRQKKTRYYSVDDKLKFIISKFKVPIVIGTDERWQNIILFKKFRDSLVHPRYGTDEVPFVAYQSYAVKGLNAVIDIINLILQSCFNKPLRRNLLDLKVTNTS